MNDELDALYRQLFSKTNNHEIALKNLANLDEPLKRELAPLLIARLEDSDRFTGVSAVLALEQLGPVTDEVIPALARTFPRPHHAVAKLAIRALSGMGPAVVEYLIAALQYREGRVAESAAQALESFDTPRAVNALSNFRRRSA